MEQNTDSTNAETPAEIAREIADDVDLWEAIEEQHGMPVWESDSLTIYADAHGYELNELADKYGIDRSELSEWMHDQADIPDYDWSANDPIVLLHD